MRKFANQQPTFTFNMTIRNLILIILSTLTTLTASAQTSAYDRYIDRYSGMAVDQMKRYGIPASITLAQGLLESAAGMSRLATKGNNHFGIKVGGTWTGPYMVMADDRPDDKFRVYRSVAESYEDHSKFLRTGRRYAFLFDLRPTDYKGWARGLKQAGYATSPTYAQGLINLIEKYNLQRFDGKHHHHEKAEERHERKEQQRLQQQAFDREVRRCNGQFYVIARSGDTFASLARIFRIKEEKLRKYNDVDQSYRLRQDNVVYLGKKRKKADRSMKRRYHVMREGESLYSIAQMYGIRLSSLCKMNPIKSDYVFRVGDEIKIK